MEAMILMVLETRTLPLEALVTTIPMDLVERVAMIRMVQETMIRMVQETRTLMDQVIMTPLMDQTTLIPMVLDDQEEETMILPLAHPILMDQETTILPTDLVKMTRHMVPETRTLMAQEQEEETITPLLDQVTVIPMALETPIHMVRAKPVTVTTKKRCYEYITSM